MPPYKSIYADWNANTPDWMPPFVSLVRGQFDKAKAIENNLFGLQQFVIGKPIWESYLRGEEANPKVAMQKVMDAVKAEVKKGLTVSRRGPGRRAVLVARLADLSWPTARPERATELGEFRFPSLSTLSGCSRHRHAASEVCFWFELFWPPCETTLSVQSRPPDLAAGRTGESNVLVRRWRK